jgi:2-keto-4-pentenoate hydratase
MSSALVDRIIEARKSGQRIATLPERQIPSNDAAAYALQDEVGDRLGMRYGGWKVGSTGPNKPPVCAPIFSADIVPSPAHILAWPGGLSAVEAEIVVKMGADLPLRAKPYSVEEVWEAVASLHVGIEYLEPRFADMRATPLLAFLVDGFGNAGLIYGPESQDWRAVDLDQPESWLYIGAQEKSHQIAGSPSGNPKPLLGWLANHCAQRGHMLKAGDLITTGSHTGIQIAPPGEPVRARFARLGEAQLTLHPRCNP